MPPKNMRDANERGIIEVLQAAGCLVIPMDRHAGFDLLVVSPDRGVLIVEIKNGEKRWKLTIAERELCSNVEYRGQTYNIVTSEAEAQELVGRDT